MSNWLKWRLIALFGVATLVSGAYVLHAQESYPPPAKTPQEAGQRFMRLLAVAATASDERSANYTIGSFNVGGRAEADGIQSLIGSVSRHDGEILGEGVWLLIRRIEFEFKAPQYTVRVLSSDDHSAQVEAEPVPGPRPLPLSVIAEDGGWRVDVIATYAKLKHLQGDALTDALVAITGQVPNGFAPTRATQNAVRSQCIRNLQQIGLAMVQYAQDYDERIVSARQWTTRLAPYVKNPSIFRCPAVPQGKSNGYALNQYLSQYNLEKVDFPAETVGVYETSNLAPDVFAPGTGRAYRHDDGANFAFIDGHIKWFARGKDTTLRFKP